MEILETFSNLISLNIFIAPIIALISGIIVAFLPCSLSLLPLLIVYISSQNKKKAIKNSIIYSIGSTITFVILGITASLIGKSLTIINKNMYIIFGIILIIVALFLLGIIKLPPFKIKNKIKKEGNWIYGIILGIISGIFISPCSTPVLIAILSIATVSQNVIFACILLLFYGIGNAIVQIIFGSFITLTDKLVNSKHYKIIGSILNIIIIIFILIIAFYMLYLGF